MSHSEAKSEKPILSRLQPIDSETEACEKENIHLVESLYRIISIHLPAERRESGERKAMREGETAITVWRGSPDWPSSSFRLFSLDSSMYPAILCVEGPRGVAKPIDCVSG